MELKPCPFCGGEAEFGGNDRTGYFVECLTCGTNDPLPNLVYSMEEVAAAWNTRAERTCRPSTNLYGYVACCSECGRSLLEHGGAGRLWHYCPNCGAKVVDE